MDSTTTTTERQARTQVNEKAPPGSGKEEVFLLIDFDGKFSPAGRALAALIDATKGRGSSTFASKKTLAAAVGCSADTMAGWLKELVESEVIGDLGREHRRTRSYYLRQPIDEMKANRPWLVVPKKYAGRPWAEVRIIAYLWRWSDHTGSVVTSAARLAAILEMSEPAAKRALRKLRADRIVKRSERVDRRWRYSLVEAPNRLPKSLPKPEPKGSKSRSPKDQNRDRTYVESPCKEVKTIRNSTSDRKELATPVAVDDGFRKSVSPEKTPGPDPTGTITRANLENPVDVIALGKQAIDLDLPGAEDTPAYLQRVVNAALAALKPEIVNPGRWFRKCLKNDWQVSPARSTSARSSHGLGHVEPLDLCSVALLWRFLARAVATGALADTPRNRHEIVAAACHARRCGDKPCALFVAMVKGGLRLTVDGREVDSITGEDERNALAMIRQYNRQRSTPMPDDDDQALLADAVQSLTLDWLVRRETEEEQAAKRTAICAGLGAR